MSNATERRCKDRNRHGDPCCVKVVNAAGYCVAHDPERPVNMRELGKASARARSRPKAERVPQGLRAYLRENVPPAEVWKALKATLESGSESARVSAARVLVNVYVEEREDRQHELQIQRAAEEFDRKIRAQGERTRIIRREQLTELLEPIAMAELADEQDELELVRALAGRVAAIPEAVRQEHAA
jgi:cell division protein ZapA (FtsZ GTPase activity inhibitor)